MSVRNRVFLTHYPEQLEDKIVYSVPKTKSESGEGQTLEKDLELSSQAAGYDSDEL